MRSNEMRQTVTLWNRWRDATGREQWQRTRLDGVWLQDRSGEAVRHAGAASSSARRIGPVSVGELLLLVPVRAGYRIPGQWRETTEPADCWTLQPGDLLAVGDCPLELSEGAAPLLDSGWRTATINLVTDYSGAPLLGHWEVQAR